MSTISTRRGAERHVGSFRAPRRTVPAMRSVRSAATVLMVLLALAALTSCATGGTPDSGAPPAPSPTTSTSAGNTSTTVAGTTARSPFEDCVRTDDVGPPPSAPSCLRKVSPAVGERLSSGLDSAAARPPAASDEPRFAGDFADPSLLVVSPTDIYAFATNSPDANVPVLHGSIGHKGGYVGDALPKLPDWSEPGFVWAPSVRKVGPSVYQLAYTTRDSASGQQCISVATASRPTGPYTDTSTGPLVCQHSLGGSIDPSTITVGATTYLLWKNDGNCCGQPTWLWSAPLSGDGRSLAGEPVALLRDDQPWEQGVIEGPSMVRTTSGYELFYSGGMWDSSDYSMAVASCEGPLGPCQKVSLAPFLSSRTGQQGPGGGQVTIAASGTAYIVYAAWTNGQVGYDDGGSRSLFATRLDLSGAEPRLPGRPS